MVNDLYGHTIGDKFLVEIAHRLSSILNDNETVFRFGGDEFVIISLTIHESYHLENRLKFISTVLSQKIHCGSGVLTPSCTIGVSIFEDCNETIDDLVKKADIALYEAKESRKGSVYFYQSELNYFIERRYAIEHEIPNGLENNEFEVFYQPQYCCKRKQFIGVEALCRWNSTKLGPIPPSEFITIAEKNMSIHDLGHFIIKQSIDDISKLTRTTWLPIHLSINVSPIQLTYSDFIDRVITVVTRAGVSPSNITFELTESATVDKLDVISSQLYRLKRLGFKLSLDDFGTGYSSLSYLNNLPFDEIKIDRSFIHTMIEDEQCNSIVKAIIAIGSSLGLSIVAEGVETYQQAQKLTQYRCDLLQGYYFSKPVNINGLKVILREHKETAQSNTIYQDSVSYY